MPLFPWRVTASGAVCVFASCVLFGSAAAQQNQSLDQALAAYVGGDYDVVARSFKESRDFMRHRLFDRRRVERWLGAWSPDKASLVAELVDRASAVSPAYVPYLVTSGQRYVLSRPSQPGASAREDDLERRWHDRVRTLAGKRSLSYLGEGRRRHADHQGEIGRTLASVAPRAS